MWMQVIGRLEGRIRCLMLVLRLSFEKSALGPMKSLTASTGCSTRYAECSECSCKLESRFRCVWSGGILKRLSWFCEMIDVQSFQNVRVN